MYINKILQYFCCIGYVRAVMVLHVKVFHVMDLLGQRHAVESRMQRAGDFQWTVQAASCWVSSILNCFNLILHQLSNEI